MLPRRWIRRAAIAVLALAASTAHGAGDGFIREELRIPLGSGPASLEALLVRPSEPGRYPLALINHGSPRSGPDRPGMTPLALLPQALEFARRGWAAAVVMRRGYGGSDGGWAENFGGCTNPNYVAAGTAAAADLRRAIEYLAERPDIDGATVISVGVSAGGFATVALAAEAPRALAAAISFAGGRGSQEADEVCQENQLIEAFRVFGQTTRVPMLWVYAENDHFFGPQLAQRLLAAFRSGGNRVDFVAAPPFGDDGHTLFSPTGIPQWTPYVDAFLKERHLAQRTAPAPLGRPALTPPAVLSARGHAAFETYLISAPHKAFAVGPDGSFGWRTGQRTTEAAKAGALQLCQQNGRDCEVRFIDDTAAGTN